MSTMYIGDVIWENPAYIGTERKCSGQMLRVLCSTVLPSQTGTGNNKVPSGSNNAPVGIEIRTLAADVDEVVCDSTASNSTNLILTRLSPTMLWSKTVNLIGLLIG